MPIVLVSGIVIGFFSGIIGIGGGIFLSPLVLLLGWTTAKQTAAISAPFILVNSIAGLSGIGIDQGGIPVEPSFIAPLVIAAIIGGVAWRNDLEVKNLVTKDFAPHLGVVIFIASIKMFFTLNNN